MEASIGATMAAVRRHGEIVTLPVASTKAGLGCLVVATGPDRRSVLTRAYATSPLRMLMPRNHGHASWVYLSSYGGGLVGGDRLDVDVHVGPNAALYMSTQASTKVYRAAVGTRSDLHARVERGATLVMAPDPVVCFRGSSYLQVQSIDVDAEARVVLVDWMSSGRLAFGERWAFDQYATRLRVRVDGAPVVHDATALRARDGDLRSRMGRFDVLATVVVAGRPLAAEARTLSSRVGRLPVGRPAVQVMASPLGEYGCLIRMAGTSVEQTAHAIRECLRFVPDLLGDDPWVRKW